MLADLVLDPEPGRERETLDLWRAVMQGRGADAAFVETAEQQLHTLMDRQTAAQLERLLHRVGFVHVQRPFTAFHTVMRVATR